MSLDVYLMGDTEQVVPEKIYVRSDGRVSELTREEWNALHPERVPVAIDSHKTKELYWANITHNLNQMANQAGLYGYLWRPGELGITKASDLIAPLATGLSFLKSHPDELRRFEPSNGWGTYEGLVEFVEKYLEACQAFPEATVQVSR